MTDLLLKLFIYGPLWVIFLGSIGFLIFIAIDSFRDGSYGWTIAIVFFFWCMAAVVVGVEYEAQREQARIEQSRLINDR